MIIRDVIDRITGAVKPKTPKPVEAYAGANADMASREGDIRSAFSSMRTGARARGDVAKREGMKELARQEAAVGGFGGAGIRMKQKGMADIQNNLAAQDADIGAQESGAVQALKGEAAQQKLASDQFSKTLAFQEKSFREQMKFNWAEMKENTRTNYINAMTALKDAGMTNEQEWTNMFKSNYVKELYPERYKVGVKNPVGGFVVSAK